MWCIYCMYNRKYPVNSEEMELFNHSLSELMTSKMNDFINFLN